MAFTPPLTPGGTCTDLTKRYADDTTRWNAVVARDASADGVFVYCVRTTKIYCRPVCKARLARRTNVVFFETTQEARRAGFRACKRCKPDDGARMPDEEATRKVQEYLRQRSDGVEPESLEVMAKRVGLSKWHFHRVFKGLVGMTPQEYVQMCRMFASEQTEPLGLEKLSWEEFTSPPVSTPVSAPAISTPLSIPSGSDWSPDFWDSTVSEGSETDFASVFNAMDNSSTLDSMATPCVDYTLRKMSFGLLLMVLQDRKVALLHQCENEEQALATLHSKFPPLLYQHRSLDELAPASEAHMRIDNMLSILEQGV